MSNKLRLARFAAVGFGTVLIGASAFAQSYAPQPGETVVRYEIENRGSILVRFYTAEAPKTTQHILKLVRQGFYDGLQFFRVERTPRPYLAFVGDPQTKSLGVEAPQVGTGGSGTKVPLEKTPFEHEEGSVGLARPREDENGGDSQIYFSLGKFKFLDGKYTIFGKVVSGIDVLRKLEKGDRIRSARIVSE